MAIRGIVRKTLYGVSIFIGLLVAAATMQIQDGVGQTQDLQIAFDGGSLTATGRLDLAEQTIHMQLTSFLDQNIMPSADRSQIGRWMICSLLFASAVVTIAGTMEPDPEEAAEHHGYCRGYPAGPDEKK